MGLFSILLASCLPPGTATTSTSPSPTPSVTPSASPSTGTKGPLQNLSLTKVACQSNESNCTQLTPSSILINQSTSTEILLYGTGFNTGTIIEIGGVRCTPPPPLNVTDTLPCVDQCTRITCEI